MSINKSLQEMNAVELVYESFRQLTREEKIAVYHKIHSDYLRAIINLDTFDDLVKSNVLSDNGPSTTVFCPTDHTHKIVRNGRDKNGQQRYLCKVCGASFSATHSSLIYRTNQDIATWHGFISGMLKQEHIESLCNVCFISKETARAWQLRVFEAIRIIIDEIKLSGTVYADDTRFAYSLKGNHGEAFVMPRHTRKRGHQNTIKNHNKNEICVLCGVDDSGHSFSKVIGFGNPSSKRVLKGFENKLDNVNVLVTDGAKYFRTAVEYYHIPDWQRKISQRRGNKYVPDTSGNYNIQKVNAYHDELKRFIRKYKGVSSRRLKGYLLLFDFLKNFKHKSLEDQCIIILSALSQITIETTIAQLETRYNLPISNGNETEVWELKIPKKHRKIYIDWVNKIPIKEIEEKYHIKKRLIYSIRDRVIKYNVHDKIMNPQPIKKSYMRAISERTWKIYTTYKQTDKNIKQVAELFEVSPQYVGRLIKTIDKRPEAIPESKKPKKRKKGKTPEQKKKELLKRNQDIYTMYKFLNTEGSVLQNIIQQIAIRFELPERTISTVLFEYRQKDNRLDSRYRWKSYRTAMSKLEYEDYLKTRNSNIYDEYIHHITVEGVKPKIKVKRCLAEKYTISLSHLDLILRKQRELVTQQTLTPE